MRAWPSSVRALAPSVFAALLAVAAEGPEPARIGG
jgi:hypothetical protein